MSSSAASLDSPSVAQANIQNFYLGILGRAPDAAGLNTWTAAYEAGVLSYSQIEAAMIASPEAQNNAVPLVALYQAAFGRVPDQPGLAGWMQARNSGVPLSAIAQAFVNSPEFQAVHGASASGINGNASAKLAFVASLYQNILGRQGAAGEIATWANSGLTADRILLGIATSPEADQKNAVGITQFLIAAGNGTESYTGTLSQQATGASTLAAQLPPGSGAVSFAPGQYITAGNVLAYDSNQPWSATAEVAFSGPAPGIGPDLPEGGAEVLFGNIGGAPDLADDVAHLVANRCAFERRLSNIPVASSACELTFALQAKLDRAGDQLLSFADWIDATAATNNACERDFRLTVIRRKATNGYRATRITESELDTRIVVDTARSKPGLSVLSANLPADKI